jgi:hypothetical protein
MGMSLYAIWTVAGTLVLFWLLGVTGAITLGGWVHALLILAMMTMALSLFSRPPRTV